MCGGRRQQQSGQEGGGGSGVECEARVPVGRPPAFCGNPAPRCVLTFDLALFWILDCFSTSLHMALLVSMVTKRDVFNSLLSGLGWQV